MKKEKLINQYEELQNQVNTFKKRMKSSDLCEDLYEDALIKKAITKKSIEDCDKNSLVEGFKKFIPHKKTLICDYFK